MKLDKNKQKNIIFTAMTGIISISVFALQQIKADNSISSIDQSNTDPTQQKIQELQQQADVYRQIIDLKRKQGDSLNNQLAITDTNIAQVQTQIDQTQQQIDDYNSQITRLNMDISEKTQLIESQKKLLGQLLQAYYQSSNTDLMSSYFAKGDFSTVLTIKDQFSQTGTKIKELVDSISDLKQNLQSQIAEIDSKKTDVVISNQKLQSQNDNLQSIKDQRQALLDQTKGEEQKYSQLLANVEEQKQELLDLDQFTASNISIGGLSVSDYINKNQPPSSLFASLSWYYSQKDSRWGDNTIGNSNSTLKAYGCAIASVAMVFKEHGDDITPAQLAKQPIFSWDLISWPKTWPDAKLTMSSDGIGHGNVNWDTIDAQLAKGNPVIVYISRTQGSGGHYVVIHHKESSTGKYVVHDPYFGPNLYLDTSRALVGSMGSQSGTVINQMIIYQ